MASRGKPGKWGLVATELGRPRDACRQQWVKMFGPEAQALEERGRQRGPFSEEEEEKLRAAVAAAREEAARTGKEVCWRDIGAAVGTRSGSDCWGKWHRTEFGNAEDGTGWTEAEEATLLQALAREEADAWPDVDWEAVASDLGESRDASACRRRVSILARRRAGGARLGPSQLCELYSQSSTATPSRPAPAASSPPARASAAPAGTARPSRAAKPRAARAAAAKAKPAKAARASPGATAASDETPTEERDEHDVVAAFAQLLGAESDDE